ncbi:hypothetical protein [Enterobacter roggenkampii]|uniref:hypothetical protein n=1 Tax=Enterobacter roggenkampii TaxID=1812935 RepID=UPI0021CD41BA|nr:hypothetical protein [Enterobacter roggenkampii]
MSTITKEQLIERLQHRISVASGFPGSEKAQMDLEMARIALASLELERGMIRRFDLDMSDCDSCGQDCGADMVEDLDGEYVLWDEVLPHLYRYDEYTAPPVPVSVPAEVGWEDVPEDITEDDMEVALAWAHGFNQCRAAMLQGAEPVTTAYKLRDAVEIIRNSGIEIDSGKIQAERDSLNSPVIPDCSCRTCRPVTFSDSRFVVCPECGNKRCPHANDHRNACTGSNEPGQEGSAYPAAPQQEVK